MEVGSLTSLGELTEDEGENGTFGSTCPLYESRGLARRINIVEIRYDMLARL